MTDSRNLADLHPEARWRVACFLAACKAVGIEIIVTCTLRSLLTQGVLYAQGRTTPGKICTNAMPGHSLHNYGMAIDCVPMRGKELVWNAIKRDDLAMWLKIGEIAEDCGLEWAGRWQGKLKEVGHMQLPIKWQELIGKPALTIEAVVARLPAPPTISRSVAT